MRVTTTRGDPDFVGDGAARKLYHVYLDGVKVSGAIEADEEAGTVRALLKHRNGEGIINRQKREAVAGTFYGDVRIVPLPD